MRLTCPNCSAEYEVDPSVIPAAGRDVQCSNCSHTWFQPPANGQATAAPRRVVRAITEDNAEEELARRRSRVAAQRAQRPAAPAPVAEPAPVRRPTAEVVPMPERDEIDDAPRPLPKRPVDEEVLRILRAEADREARARRGEPLEALEAQQEMALGGSAPSQSSRVPTDPRDLSDEDLVPSGGFGRRRKEKRPTPGSARAQLPDVDQITNSLRASSERPGSAAAYMEVEETLRRVRRGQGFRLGFSLMLLIAAAGIFAYVFSAEIIGRFPEAEPYVLRYVTEVNVARTWLDETVRTLTAQVLTLIGDATGG